MADFLLRGDHARQYKPAMASAPSILLVIDRPKWAFAHIAEALKLHLGARSRAPLRFTIRTFENLSSLPKESRFDVAVCFWWGHAETIRALGIADHIVLAVYDHLSWCESDAARARFTASVRSSDQIIAANDRLASELAWTDLPVAVCEDGVDRARFTPRAMPPCFTVGWAGNSDAGGGHVKGFYLIVEAANRAGVAFHHADVVTRRLPFEAMPAFYGEVSVLACASTCEGTPNPVLEAMASGRPVVSTRVGIVEKVVRHGETGLLVERSVDALADAFARLRALSPEALVRMGLAARMATAPFDWKEKVLAWQECLTMTLGRKPRRGIATVAVPDPPDTKDAREPRSVARHPKDLSVGFLLPMLQMGGIERWATDLAASLSTRGIRSEAVVLSDENTSALALAALGASAPVSFGNECVRGLADRSDLVVVAGIHAWWEVVPVEAWPKTVLTMHGANPWSQDLYRESPLPLGVVAVSEDARKALPDALRHRAVVIEHRVDRSRAVPNEHRSETMHRWGVPSNRHVVGYIGRLEPDKDPDLFIDVIRDLDRLAPRVYHGVVIGRGRMEPRLRARADGLPVTFAGDIEDIGSALGAVDTLLVTSPSEGFSFVTVEAWLAGVAVASRITGIAAEAPELVLRIDFPNDGSTDIAESILDDHASPRRFERTRLARPWARARFTDSSSPDAWASYLRGLMPTGIPILNAHGCRPRRLWINWYIDPDAERQAEIERALEKNLASCLFSEIVLLADPAAQDPFSGTDASVVRIGVAARPSFDTFFAEIASRSLDTDLNVIANSDIYFDETLALLDHYPMAGRCVALSRWDVESDGSSRFLDEHGYTRAWSQDAWIFLGIPRGIEADFLLGKRGCDNRLAHEIARAGYHVENPSVTVKAHHLHQTAIRRYTQGDEDLVPKPYKGIEQTPLVDTRVLHVALSSGGRQRALCDALAMLGPYRELDWTSIDRQRVAREIARVADEHAPTLTFCQIQTDGVVTRDMIERLPGLTVNWTGDARSPMPTWYEDLAPAFSLTCFSNATDAAALVRRGLRAAYLQIGFDPEVYTPDGDLGGYPAIVFLANEYKDNFPLGALRREVVARLSKAFGRDFAVYGRGWGDGTRSLDPLEEARCYRSCKIAIGTSHLDLSRYTSDRMYRAMGSGAFYLTRDYPDRAVDFRDGVDVAVWRDVGELIERCHYYLEHEDERQRIATTGTRLVRSRHTWVGRISELCAITGVFGAQ